MIKAPANVDISLILRGFFAAAVVFWHTVGYRLDIPELKAFNISGRFAVWMFFGLSGYVIGHGFFSNRYKLTWPGLMDYWKRRFVRLLPLFLLISCIAYALLWWRGQSFWELLATVPQSIGTLQWQHYEYPVGVFWTLGVELHFYLVVPLIAFAVVAARRLGTLILVALYAGLWFWFGNDIDNRSMVGNLQHFVIGLTISKLFVDGYLERFIRSKGAIAVQAGVALISIATVNILYHKGVFWAYQGSLMSDAALAALLLVHCAIDRKGVEANKLTSGLMWVGVLAYGLYAWHGLILTFFPWFLDRFIATLVVSLLLACLSYTLMERRFLDAHRKRSAKNVNLGSGPLN